MNRSPLRSLSVVFVSAVVALWPLAAAAQPAPSTPLTAEQVRNEFLSQGYLADAPITWWTNNLTTFSVSDRTQQASRTGRVLMVLVYPDAATAQAETDKARALELAANPELAVVAGGPHLVPGYGPSILRGNVALVESTQHELAQRYAEQLNLDNQVAFGTTPAQIGSPPASYLVDLDFVSALDNSTADL